MEVLLDTLSVQILCVIVKICSMEISIYNGIIEWLPVSLIWVCLGVFDYFGFC